MKKILLAAFAAALMFFAQNASAQKIGYVYSDSILFALPDYKVKSKELESYQQKLQVQLENQQKELQMKFAEYQKSAADMPPLVLQEKQKELQQLEMNLQEFQGKAQQGLQAKEQELLKPLFEKIKQGISDVAKEQGYSYVLDRQVMLFADEGSDLTKAVIKKLGGQ